MESSKLIAGGKHSQDLESVCSQPWDVIVIGAGPAGSVAAHRSAMSGLRTLIVDRKAFPRTKVCGACINGRALNVIRQAGLGEVVDSLDGVPLTQFCVRASPTREAQVPLPPTSLAVGRDELDSALVKAAIHEGAHFEPGTTATVLNATDGVTRQVALSQHDRRLMARSSLVIVADGLSQSCLKELPEFQSTTTRATRVGVGGVVEAGNDNSYERGRIYMAVNRQGYVGVVRLKDDRFNVAAAVCPDVVKNSRSTSHLIGQMLESVGFPIPIELDNVRWGGTVGLTRTSNRVAGTRLLLVGDAGGYVEPFTGEGIAWAVTTGAAAASLGHRSMINWSSKTESMWTQNHASLVKRHQLWCRRLAGLLRYPAVVRSSLFLMNKFPQVVRPLVRHLNEPANVDHPRSQTSARGAKGIGHGV